ncbi:hypothetical protein [Streptomyces sp. MJP52]|uniref:hypothetical protein n=1 Tax=Streptomyces sp. MJP52 TaxID=2940555 RepID=UPI0024754914|nr:hypothetical protein [Streptomyces sp. MJP52]MDH6224776.1 hypothetical protein [Streptomyces sp. MJP52]
MAHVDPAHLMELALGNSGLPDDGALRHIAGCGRCREELRRTARVVAAARGVQERDLPVAPPERVWQAVTRDLATTDRAPRAAVPGPAAVVPGAGGRPSRGTGAPGPRAAPGLPVGRSARDGAPHGPPSPLRARRRHQASREPAGRPARRAVTNGPAKPPPAPGDPSRTVPPVPR